jgi:hypothetical protein
VHSWPLLTQFAQGGAPVHYRPLIKSVDDPRAHEGAMRVVPLASEPCKTNMQCRHSSCVSGCHW